MLFRDAFIFARALTIRKVTNLFLLKISYLISVSTRKYVHWGAPANISVEPTSLCNLACPECPSGNNTLARRRGNMSFSKFRQYIEPYINSLFTCTLYFQGEPLLNPELFRMIEYLKKKRIYTIISTNAHFLSISNCEKLIMAGVSRIIISIDGTTPETYTQYRYGGSLTKTLEGIKNLVSTRSRLKSINPVLINQFIVFKHNQHQINVVKKLSNDLKVDRLWLKAPQIYNFDVNENLLPTFKKYNRYTKDPNGQYILKGSPKNCCWRSWQNPAITIDGEMLPCCFDKDANYSYGNTSSSKPWENKTAGNFRTRILKSRKSIDICRNCTEGIRYLFHS